MLVRTVFPEKTDSELLHTDNTLFSLFSVLAALFLLTVDSVGSSLW